MSPHHCTRAECDLEAGVEAASCGVGSTAGCVGSGFHSDKSGKSGEESSREEGERYPRVLDVEAISKDGEEYGQDGKDYNDYLVLLFEVCHCTFANILRYLAHSGRSFIFFFHLAIEYRSESQRQHRGQRDQIE